MDTKLLIVIAVLFIAFVLIFSFALIFSKNNKGLDSIKSVRVGDGQHGNASWGDTSDLKDKGFVQVSFPSQMKEMKDWPVGRVLHWDEDGKKAWVDPSSSHCATMAPTDVGKTTKFVVPNIMYNAMAGANMIIPDLKGEINKLLANDLREKLKYNVVNINFSDVEASVGIDYLELLRESVENIKTYPNRAGYWSAEAETQAKIVAGQIQASRERGSQENGFFLSASNGILSCVLYLVALYGDSTQTHFSSVRSIIQELGTARKTEGKSALQELLESFPVDFPPRKLSGAAYTAPAETEANIYASALGDLDIYTNAMAEQVIATAKKSFDWKDLVDSDKKTIVFIELPETRKDMFVFFTLFINQLYERLSHFAQAQPTGKLPRILKIIWDEFGISPKLNDLPTMLNVSRGRGILFDIIYQSEDQLEEVYGKVGQQIVQKACNTNLYLGLAPKDIETAKNLSTVLGTYTAKAGSISRSYTNKDILFSETNRSLTEQMQSRDLASADELLRMGSTSILIKQNMRPLRPNNIPFYAKEYPTKLMNHEAPTDRQVNLITEYLESTSIDDSQPIEELETYKQYLKEKTVSNAEAFIIQAQHLVERVDTWYQVQHLSFDDVVKKLEQEKLKVLQKGRPTAMYSSELKTKKPSFEDQFVENKETQSAIKVLLREIAMLLKRNPDNETLIEYQQFLIVNSNYVDEDKRLEIASYIKKAKLDIRS